jgi:copper chaperone CopZ
MKTLLASLVLLALLFGPVISQAAEVTYTAGMKGIDCADCKKTISRALGTIKGVKTIRIVKEGDDQHRLTVVTDGSKAITKAEAVAALGKDSHYSITSWSQGS